MSLRVQRLDKRMNGVDRFTHRVVFGGGSLVHIYTAFTKARNYLWTNFGASGELDLARDFYFGANPTWAWINDEKTTAIYLRDDALTQFLLKMESFQ